MKGWRSGLGIGFEGQAIGESDNIARVYVGRMSRPTERIRRTMEAAVSAAPQARKIIKTREIGNFSLWMYAVNVTGFACWTT